jgi:hypothetical protein
LGTFLHLQVPLALDLFNTAVLLKATTVAQVFSQAEIEKLLRSDSGALGTVEN